MYIAIVYCTVFNLQCYCTALEDFSNHVHQNYTEYSHWPSQVICHCFTHQ